MSNVNTEIFTNWIEQDLLPKLPRNSVIIMDNTSFHKGSSMRILECLLPFSLDLNPIEQKWEQDKSQYEKKRCSIDDIKRYYRSVAVSHESA